MLGELAPAAHARRHEHLLNATFVFSPWGSFVKKYPWGGNSSAGGHQNHREWEALLAGSIPLVDFDPLLSPLWAGLPVVEVRNWRDVTPNIAHQTAIVWPCISPAPGGGGVE